jgi:hypothetical protein
MIYLSPPSDAPIQQGDIFRGIPRIDITLDSLSLLEEGEQIATTWHDIITGDDLSQPITAVLPVKPVLAIVITQNCDAVRSPALSLCEITDFLTEAEKASPPKNAKSWMSKILKTITERPSIFYLPASDLPDLAGRKAVDFRSVLRVLRVDLEKMKDNRIARLNNVAYEHFRESLAQFFRRYPVNAWYPMNKEEFEAYAETQKTEHIEPYSWQE